MHRLNGAGIAYQECGVVVIDDFVAAVGENHAKEREETRYDAAQRCKEQKREHTSEPFPGPDLQVAYETKSRFPSVLAWYRSAAHQGPSSHSGA